MPWGQKWPRPRGHIFYIGLYREKQGKSSCLIREEFKFFQGQGIVREFYVVSVKNGYLLKCQGNVREFYNFQFVSNDEKQKYARTVFFTFWIQAK